MAYAHDIRDQLTKSSAEVVSLVAEVDARALVLDDVGLAELIGGLVRLHQGGEFGVGGRVGVEGGLDFDGVLGLFFIEAEEGFNLRPDGLGGVGGGGLQDLGAEGGDEELHGVHGGFSIEFGDGGCQGRGDFWDPKGGVV